MSNFRALRAYAWSMSPLPGMPAGAPPGRGICASCGGRTYKGHAKCSKCARQSRPGLTAQERSEIARASANARWEGVPRKPVTGCRAGDHSSCELDARHGNCSECGKTIAVTRTSAPPERRRCRECQRSGPSYRPRQRVPAFVPQTLTCPTCGEAFTQHRSQQKYCCIEHRPPQPGTRTAGRVAASRRRRLRVATTWDGVTDAEIFERDRWMCGICRKRIGKKFRYPHPRSASIDHLLPLSLGGDDTALNKRAAHLGCNVSRNAGRPDEQMPLPFAVEDGGLLEDRRRTVRQVRVASAQAVSDDWFDVALRQYRESHRVSRAG